MIARLSCAVQSECAPRNRCIDCVDTIQVVDIMNTFALGAFPIVAVISTMNCGTTSLHELFAQHPDVSASVPKEINFFSGENVDKPLECYKAHLDPAKPVWVESSQNYSKVHYPFYAGAPARMANIIPDTKLILVGKRARPENTTT